LRRNRLGIDLVGHDAPASASAGVELVQGVADGKQYVATTSSLTSGFLGGFGTSAIIVFAALSPSSFCFQKTSDA
jgi:hypothetical protein